MHLLLRRVPSLSVCSTSRFFFASDRVGLPFHSAAISSAVTGKWSLIISCSTNGFIGLVEILVCMCSIVVWVIQLQPVSFVMIGEMAFNLSMFCISMLFRFVEVRSIVMSPSVKHFFPSFLICESVF